MRAYRRSGRSLFLFSLCLSCPVFFTAPLLVQAGDVGVGRRTGGIAEIDPLSAVAGSTEVRSLPTQQGAPGPIRVREPATGAILGNGMANAEGQYAIPLSSPLVTSQIIQAENTRKNFFSSGIAVMTEAAPAIEEPVQAGTKTIRGRGTPGHRVKILNAVTGAVLGGPSAPVLSNGRFTIQLTRPLSLFHTIQADDIAPGLLGKLVPVLNLPAAAVRLPVNCPSAAGPASVNGFTTRNFRCGLPRPRGAVVNAAGKVFVVAGTVPEDPGLAIPPAGVFEFTPPVGAGAAGIQLFAPVNGIAVKIGAGGSVFGQDLFIARPRLFNVRGSVLIGPDEGEIFRVNLSSALHEATVFTRLLEAGPSGMAFDPTSNSLVVSSVFGDQLMRVTASGTMPTVVANLSGVQGLTFGPCSGAGTCSGSASCLYAAQPSSGQILCSPSGSGLFSPFITNLDSPVDVTFGPGGAFGSYLYITDAGRGNLLRYNVQTGKPVDATPFISGMQAPFGLAFRANGQALFVTDYLTGAVVQISPVP